MTGRQKVTVVGAGNVGATAAQEIARRDYADVVLVDIKENLPQGKALDLNEAGPVLGYEPTIAGSNGYDATAGSDVVVVTAGLPRKPGMSRDDLVTTNESIVGSVTREAVEHSPDAVLIVVSNPLDAMPRRDERPGFPKERVFMAGILDTALQHVHRLGDRRVREGRDRDGARRPRRPDGAGGLRDDRGRHSAHAAHLRRTDRGDGRAHAQGGGEVVNPSTRPPGTRGRSGRADGGPVCLDQKRVPSCTATSKGVRNRRPLLGVPVKIGAGGIEEIVELELSEDERAELDKSADAVREVVGVLAGSS
jgi:malate dehydrogenase